MKYSPYSTREDYLDSLAARYDVPKEAVYALAQMLGPNEDFDGLIIALEDDICEM